MQPIDAKMVLSVVDGHGTKSAIGVAAKRQTPLPQDSSVHQDTPSPEQVRQAITAANGALKAISSSLEFTQDPSTGKTVVRIIDAGTKQVIRQFPSEEMLVIARAIDRMQGLLLKEKA